MASPLASSSVPAMEPAGHEIPRKSAFLDRPVARFVALGVFFGAALALAWSHRDDLIPPPAALARAGDDPVAVCLATRAGDIDRMRDERVITDDQASLFKSRAEALCVAQHGQGSGPPSRN